VTIALVDVPVALRPHVAQVKHLLGCFARNFSGRPHAASDRRLLGELITRLEHIAAHVTELPAIGSAVAQRLDMLRSLAREIETVERAPPAEYAGHLASRANQQFLLFKRLVVRPDTSPPCPRRAHRRQPRGARARDESGRGVGSPSGAARSQPDAGDRELARARAELQDPAMETTNLPATEQLRLFAAAANAEREDYRASFMGRDRNTVDVEQLAGICDRVGELAYQIANLPGELAAETLQQVSANLGRVRGRVQHARRAAEAGPLVRPRRRQRRRAADAADGRGCAEAVRRQAVAQLDALLSDPLVSELVGVTGS